MRLLDNGHFIYDNDVNCKPFIVKFKSNLSDINHDKMNDDDDLVLFNVKFNIDINHDHIFNDIVLHKKDNDEIFDLLFWFLKYKILSNGFQKIDITPSNTKEIYFVDDGEKYKMSLNTLKHLINEGFKLALRYTGDAIMISEDNDKHIFITTLYVYPERTVNKKYIRQILKLIKNRQDLH